MSSSNLLSDIYIYVNIYTEIFKSRPALAGIPVRLKIWVFCRVLYRGAFLLDVCIYGCFLCISDVWLYY